MSTKALVDVNLSRRIWMPRLEAAGVDAIHWLGLGPGNAPDSEILARAAADGYVVVTRDIRISRQMALSGATKPSVVHLRFARALEPRDICERVAIAFRQFEEELREGAIVSISPSGMRCYLLPIRRRPRPRRV